ncbi:MAG: hypothetical protein ABII01_06650 [Candidatus Woesearchaeota archaeon]
MKKIILIIILILALFIIGCDYSLNKEGSCYLGGSDDCNRSCEVDSDCHYSCCGCLNLEEICKGAEIATCAGPYDCSCIENKCMSSEEKEEILGEINSPISIEIGEKEISDDLILKLYKYYVKRMALVGVGLECFEKPEIKKKEFEYLKPKKVLFRLIVDCKYDVMHPNSYIADLLVYKQDENLVGRLIALFENFRVDHYFSDIFEPIDSKEALEEYLYFVQYSDLELFDVLEKRATWDTDEECVLLIDEVPEVNSTITQTEEGFVYEGFDMNSEGIVTIWYHRIVFTNNGEVRREATKQVAECGEGIEY